MGPSELPVEEAEPRYAPAVAGTWLGALIGGGAGLAVSIAYVDDLEEPARGGYAVLALTFLLLFVGGTAGCWAALKMTRDGATGRTTFMVAAGLLAWAVVSVPSVFWALDAFPRSKPEIYLSFALLVAMLTVPPALAARALIVHSDKLRDREETSR